MVFFLSIGLLIDLQFLLDNLGLVIILWLFVSVFKTALNVGLLHLFGEPWRHAFLASLMLAQIGEFSFVLGAVAMDHRIIASETHRLIVAITVLSLIISPLWLNTMHRLQHRATDRIHSLGDLLHFVYYREWHFVDEFSRNTIIRTKVIFRNLKQFWIKISEQASKRIKGYEKD